MAAELNAREIVNEMVLKHGSLNNAALQSGMSKSYLHDIYHGVRNPTLRPSTAEKMLESLGKSYAGEMAKLVSKEKKPDSLDTAARIAKWVRSLPAEKQRRIVDTLEMMGFE